MELSSDRLNALSTLSQVGSFSKAAQRLGLTQSALSQRIQKLEDELETTLVIREPSGIRLTDPGLALAHFCNRVNQLEEEVLGQIQLNQGELAGPVRIASYSSVTRSLVIPALKELAKAYPKLIFEISSREMRQLYPMLKTGEVDFIITNGQVEADNIESIVLATEENVHIVPTQNNKSEIFLDHDPDDQTTHQFMKLQKKRRPNIQRSYFDDVYGIIDAVSNGMGQAIVSRHLLKGIKGIQIVKNQIPLRDSITLHYFKAPYYPKKHQEIVKALVHKIPILMKSHS